MEHPNREEEMGGIISFLRQLSWQKPQGKETENSPKKENIQDHHIGQNPHYHVEEALPAGSSAVSFIPSSKPMHKGERNVTMLSEKHKRIRSLLVNKIIGTGSLKKPMPS